MYINILLKTIHGRDRRPNFLIFVVFSALIFAGWVVLAWSKMSDLGAVELHLMCS